MTESNDFSLATLVAESPTSFHAAQFITELLVEAGCKRISPQQKFSNTPGSYVLTQDGAVAAWYLPATAAAAKTLRFNVIAGHTDSPAFKLKPCPDHTGPGEFNQLAVEVYGGMLPNSWLDRDLGIAGQIIDTDGNKHLVRLDDICRIPQLAVHLDRDSARKVELNRQRQLRPVWGVGRDESILDVIAEIAGLDSGKQIIAHDLFLFDSVGPRTIGIDGEFIVSGRQDNLATMYSETAAFKELLTALGKSETKCDESADETVTIPVMMGFDHEEIGSATATGAAGPILASLLRRIAATCGVEGAEFDRAIANSICLSSDVAHSVHPNYSDKHDEDHLPVLGGGPVLKVNANQRYATEAVGTAEFVRACKEADIPVQYFVSNNEVPCGSTIGPITATRLGIRTVDVGTPILSMHSLREMSMISDHDAMAEAMLHWWQTV